MSTQQSRTSSFTARLVRKALLLGYVVTSSLLALTACGGRSNSNEAATDTKTNWLGNCEADTDCSDGLSCLCGVCTRECEAEDACNGLAGARCSARSGCGEAALVCIAPDHDATDAAAPTPADDGEQTTDDVVDEEVTSEPDEPANDDSASSDDGSVPPAPEPTAPGSEPPLEPSDAGSAECPRPLNEYSILGDDCFLADFACPDYFIDECGCGCEGLADAGGEGELCGLARSQYVAVGDSCLTARFACDEAGEEMFTNECGCGCAPSTGDAGSNECAIEGRAYVATSPERCAAVTFMCVDGATAFFDDCGCGCHLAADAGIKCESEARQYQSRVPEQCQVLDFVCEDGTTYFGDECGCGCETQSEVPVSCEPGPGSAVPADVLDLGFDTCDFNESVAAAAGLIESDEELLVLYEACEVTPNELAIDFAEKRLFVAVLNQAPGLQFNYAVENDGIVHVGVQADSWCRDAVAPAGIVAVELDVSDSDVEQDTCQTNVCAPF
jgi:hypothetical protein